MAPDNPVRIAMVGCGAVAELFHLPAIARNQNCVLTSLVDTDSRRLKQLAQIYHPSSMTMDFREIKGRVDAAIVALPHHLHMTVCPELLAAGIHVLVEKPMALSFSQCQAIIGAADSTRSVLAVGLVRRFGPSTIWLREIIRSESFGKLRSFEILEGGSYNWPVQSDFFLRREMAGGGVLFDTGAHTLDQLLYWLGDVSLRRYCDDSYGGVEADCRIEVTTASGALGLVELSRTRNLRNTAVFEFERSTVEVALTQDWARVLFNSTGMALTGLGVPQQSVSSAGHIPSPRQLPDLFDAQLADFLAAVRGGTSPRVPGTEAARSIAFIEQCCKSREPLDLPWMQFELSARNK